MGKSVKYAIVGVLVAGFVFTSVQVKRSELKGGTLVIGHGKIETTTSDTHMTGRMAPDFSLKTLGGDEVSLADFKGQTVLLEIWASSNPASRPAMIITSALEAKYKDKGLKVMSINQKETPAVAKAFAKEMRFTSPVLLDEDGSVSERYKASRLPTLILIDKTGKVAMYNAEFAPYAAELVERKICELLGVEYVQGFSVRRSK
jgi:peroxiredoxin